MGCGYGMGTAPKPMIPSRMRGFLGCYGVLVWIMVENMKFMGLRACLWKQWLGAVWRNGGKDPVSLANAALSVATGGVVDRRVWRARVRACSGCAVYQREARICAGCGCHAPVKALDPAGKCWLGRKWG